MGPTRTALLIALAALARVDPAAAQDVASAEALYNRGVADMKAGRYQEGCRAIAESQRIDPRPGTLFTLAECENRWGHTASAAAHFSDYLEIYEKLPRAQKLRQGRRPQVAKKERDRLRAESPELTLVLPPTAPGGLVVKRDGEVVGSAAIGVPLPVDPGPHTVSTEVPGTEPWEEEISLAPKEKREVTLGVNLPKPGPLKPIASGAGEGDAGVSAGRRALTYTVGGLGVAGLAVGGVMGALALGAKGTMDEHCGSAIGQSNARVCDAAGLDAVDRVKTMGLVSTIGFAVGAVGVGTAVVLLVTEPGGSEKGGAGTTTATDTRGGAGDAAAGPRTRPGAPWVSAGVLSAGPLGALLGARGVW
ncbi:tetratricopeptide repeat protein [Chondromyces apiculatus]|uniref:PEGA domain-containing protein n=1 Tax=Chondromyces apiculatus DSM 436 TaxID=1192034 RepID=A0A017T3F1_9BACT|nr:tetratricopeptide repeat protein [Chondromyces apiculatus]EYF03773.1 Hypothetical protein CAP_5203 [Chondromyces apiculatus DSM 436]